MSSMLHSLSDLRSHSAMLTIVKTTTHAQLHRQPPSLKQVPGHSPVLYLYLFFNHPLPSHFFMHAAYSASWLSAVETILPLPNKKPTLLFFTVFIYCLHLLFLQKSFNSCSFSQNIWLQIKTLLPAFSLPNHNISETIEENVAKN